MNLSFKKLFVFFCFLYFIVLNAFSFNASVTDWHGTNSGDYVVYKDCTWKEDTWIGFLYYNANTIGSFLYTSGGNTFVKILFSGEEFDGEFVITGQNIISGINNDLDYTYAVNYLMEILPKLYSWKTEPNTESIVIKRSYKLIDEAQFGGTCEIRFSSYIPLFYIENILNNEQQSVFFLEEMGLAQDDKAFFNFSPIESIAEKTSEFILNEDAEKEIRNIDGVTILLDSQWKQIADNSFFMGNEAFLNVNTIDLKNIIDEKKDVISFLIKYLSSSGTFAKVLSRKTDISGNSVNFKLKNQVYDIQTKTVKYDIKNIKRKSDSEYIITSLTVDKSSYEKYKDYFDKLF